MPASKHLRSASYDGTLPLGWRSQGSGRDGSFEHVARSMIGVRH